MNHTRLIGIVGLVGAAFLLGMRLAPQGAISKNALDRHAAADKIIKLAEALDERGSVVWGEASGELELRVLWSRRLAEASVEAGAKTGRDAYSAHVERVQKLATRTEALSDSGRGLSTDVDAMRFHLAEAKLLLERAK